MKNAGITRDMTFRKMVKGRLGCGAAREPPLDLQHDQAGYESMMDRGWGRIINVSFGNGSKGAFGGQHHAVSDLLCTPFCAPCTPQTR